MFRYGLLYLSCLQRAALAAKDNYQDGDLSRTNLQTDLGPLDPNIKSQMEQDAAKLQQSGFNLYEPTFASSINARTVIQMGQAEDSSSTHVPQEVQTQPDNAKSRVRTGT